MEKAQKLVSHLSEQADSRIKLLHGDITQPFCGLSEDTFMSYRESRSFLSYSTP